MGESCNPNSTGYLAEFLDQPFTKLCAEDTDLQYLGPTGHPGRGGRLLRKLREAVVIKHPLNFQQFGTGQGTFPVPWYGLRGPSLYETGRHGVREHK
jgi:hypothetical protein